MEMITAIIIKQNWSVMPIFSQQSASAGATNANVNLYKIRE